jgi:hypothetical protein
MGTMNNFKKLSTAMIFGAALLASGLPALARDRDDDRRYNERNSYNEARYDRDDRDFRSSRDFRFDRREFEERARHERHERLERERARFANQYRDYDDTYYAPQPYGYRPGFSASVTFGARR